VSGERDVIVIGAGANGLVTAHALARRGRRVLVLERRAALDAGWDEGWVPPKVMRACGIEGALGIEAPDPWLSVLLGDGGRLDLSRDVAASAAAIARVSPKDGARWPEFCARMYRLARLLERVYSQPAPDVETTSPVELLRLAALGVQARRLGREGMIDLLRTPPMAVAELLDEWFEHDELKGALAAAGILHMHQGPRSGGTAFVFLHHHAGSQPGVFRPPRCYLGTLLSRREGVELRTGAMVERILVRDGRVSGVVLAGGEEILANVVASSADPRATLLGMVEAEWLAPEFRREVGNIKCRGVLARVELELEESANFSRLVHAPSMTYLERAFDDVKYGRVSSQLYAEVTAQGRSAVVEVQYVPRRLATGEWNDERRLALGNVVVDTLGERAPSLTAAHVRSVTTPADYEAGHGLSGGHLLHGEHTLDQVLFARPIAGWSRHRTPLPGLYLCGSGTHPGGMIPGGAGVLAAGSIMEDGIR
jgi:phytoene dehydrogenase-like protein